MTTDDNSISFENVIQRARALQAEQRRLREAAARHRDELRRTVADVRNVIAHRRTDLGGILAKHSDLMGDTDT